MINVFGSPPNLCYDAVVETLSTINNTSLPKSPSESVQYPLSRMQRNKCMFVNQLMAEAMMEMVDESEVQSRATQQLINVSETVWQSSKNLPTCLWASFALRLQIVTL